MPYFTLPPGHPQGYSFRVRAVHGSGFVISWYGHSFQLRYHGNAALTSELVEAMRFAMHFENLFIRPNRTPAQQEQARQALFSLRAHAARKAA